MYLVLMIVGVALWAVAHLFKRIAPDARASMGDGGKGAVALVLLVSIILMVIGFRGADVGQVWYPPVWATHLNNLLVLIAIFMMSPAPRKGKLLNSMRHPMLTGFGLWALAHLLVNGDLASVILFCGLLLWAVAEVVAINRAEPRWQPSEFGTYAKDGMFLVASIVLMGVIGYIHSWLGYWPFG
ncbi:NnrU family protein [Nioella sp.]|uniref:NnrU family protein n=1 Tax=Nioella sp. TaxID=1912091 RepID=UPI003519C8DA